MKIKINDQAEMTAPALSANEKNDTVNPSVLEGNSANGNSDSIDTDKTNVESFNPFCDNCQKQEITPNLLETSPLFNAFNKQPSMLTKKDEQETLQYMLGYTQELNNSFEIANLSSLSATSDNQNEVKLCSSSESSGGEAFFGDFISELEIDDYPPEDEKKVEILNSFIKDFNAQAWAVVDQDREDGVMGKLLDSGNVLLHCGVTKEEVDKFTEIQKSNIEILIKALNGEYKDSFEEVYKRITGVEYDEEKIIEYQENSYLYSSSYMTMQIAQECQDAALSATSMEEVLNAYTKYYGDEDKGLTELNKILTQKYKEINDARKDTSANGWISSANIVKVDGEYKVSVVTVNTDLSYDDNGEVIIESSKTVSYHDIAETANLIKPELENTSAVTGKNNFIVDAKTKINNILATMDGYDSENPENNLEILTKNYAESKKEAVGNIDVLEGLVNQYCQSHSEYIDKISSMTQFTGMGLVAIGGIVSFVAPPLGVAMMAAGGKMSLAGMFSNNVLKAIDGLTSKNGLTRDELKEIFIETVKEIGYVALGRGINSVAELAQAGSLEALQNLGLSDKSAKVLSWLAEGGTDMALSVLSDVIITGDANFDGNSLQVLLGILTGVANAKVKSYQENLAVDSKIKDIREELGDISETDANTEVLKRFGYSDSEIAKMASKPASEVDRIIINNRKTRAYKYVMEQQGIDTSKMSEQEIRTKGAIIDAFTKNIDKVTQDGNDGTCAIAAILNGIARKGKNAAQRLYERFTFDETTGKFSCSELGIEGVKVDISAGENAALKIYEAYKASNPNMSEGACVAKIIDALIGNGSDILAKFKDGNIADIIKYVNDDDTILTLNVGKDTEVKNADGKASTLKEGHGYTLAGYNENTKEFILEDPQGKTIKVSESDYEKLQEADAQVEGKTWKDEGFAEDGVTGRMVGGKNSNKYTNNPLDTQFGQLQKVFGAKTDRDGNIVLLGDDRVGLASFDSTTGIATITLDDGGIIELKQNGTVTEYKSAKDKSQGIYKSTDPNSNIEESYKTSDGTVRKKRYNDATPDNYTETWKQNEQIMKKTHQVGDDPEKYIVESVTKKGNPDGIYKEVHNSNTDIEITRKVGNDTYTEKLDAGSKGYFEVTKDSDPNYKTYYKADTEPEYNSGRVLRSINMQHTTCRGVDNKFTYDFGQGRDAHDSTKKIGVFLRGIHTPEALQHIVDIAKEGGGRIRGEGYIDGNYVGIYANVSDITVSGSKRLITVSYTDADGFLSKTTIEIDGGNIRTGINGSNVEFIESCDGCNSTRNKKTFIPEQAYTDIDNQLSSQNIKTVESDIGSKYFAVLDSNNHVHYFTTAGQTTYEVSPTDNIVKKLQKKLLSIPMAKLSVAW